MCNTCVSMPSPTTPHLSLCKFGLNPRGELWKEGEVQCCKQNPQMPQTKHTAKLIHDVLICAQEKGEASLVYPSNCKAFTVAVGGFISDAVVEVLLFF